MCIRDRDSNVDQALADNILRDTVVFKPAGAADGYDHVFIYATDVLKTLYDAQVGNFGATVEDTQAIALNNLSLIHI